MPVPKTTPTTVDVQYVAGSLPQGEFVGGLPVDGSIITVPAALAEAWIAAGIAQRPSAAIAVTADKEIE